MGYDFRLKVEYWTCRGGPLRDVIGNIVANIICLQIMEIRNKFEFFWDTDAFKRGVHNLMCIL